MKLIPLAVMLVALVGSSATAADDATAFHDPQLLKADGKLIEVESPGYAAPCLADLDGDGIRDLLVGQLTDGKIGFYKGRKTEDGSLDFDARAWLEAGGEVVKIPGMW